MLQRQHTVISGVELTRQLSPPPKFCTVRILSEISILSENFRPKMLNLELETSNFEKIRGKEPQN